MTDDLIAWSATECPLVDLDRETAKLRDHTYKTARSDWAGTWRNWMRTAQQDAESRQTRTSAAKQPQQAKSFAQQDREAGMARWEEQTGRIHPDRLKAQQLDAIDVTPKTLEIAQ